MMDARDTFDSSSHGLGRGDGNASSGKSQRNNEERGTEHDEDKALQGGDTVVRVVSNDESSVVMLLLRSLVLEHDDSTQTQH